MPLGKAFSQNGFLFICVLKGNLNKWCQVLLDERQLNSENPNYFKISWSSWEWESQFLGRLIRSPGSPRRRKGSGALEVEIGGLEFSRRRKGQTCFPTHTHSLLLLLLSRFSRVRLCATPQTAAHQAPPSLGFSRQEHWSRLPFPSPMLESEKWKWSRSAVSDSATPWSAAHQAPPSLGFYRQEHWSGCHCLLPKPHRPGEYEVPVSTGFSVVTKHGHKVAASLPAPLLGFLLFVF